MNIERATPQKTIPAQIIGRVVGEQGSHIAVAHIPEDDNSCAGYLLAVRHDGREYVTWAYQSGNNGVPVFWGHYFTIGPSSATPHEVFRQACRDLVDRAFPNPCEVDHCTDLATACKCGAAHCPAHPHIQ